MIDPLHAPDDQEFARWLAGRQEAIDRGETEISDAPVIPAGDQLKVARYERSEDCLHALAALRNCRKEGLRARESADSTPRRIGPYEIEHELGRGGLGIVFCATDRQLNRRVAIKVPKPEAIFSEDMRRRFIAEAESAARLDHPNLCRVYETGQDGPITYIVAEYCEGLNLAQWIAGQKSPPTPESVAELIAKLADAIHHAHLRGVLHRDLKPSNVLLVARLNDGETSSEGSADLRFAKERDFPFLAKIADFGLAKILDEKSQATLTGTVIGTADYMSPEQAEGRTSDIGVGSDVYSLGVILYEVLTLQRPFSAESTTATMKKLLLEDPPSLASFISKVPADLEAICLKCLEKDPTARYGSAGELADDLRRWLSGNPTKARPVGRAERALRWMRRNRTVTALIGLSLIAVCTALVTFVAYNVRLNNSLKTLRRYTYAVDMRQAAQAWQNDDLSTMEEKLARYLPNEGGEDLRTFPWKFLNGRAHAELKTLTGHQGDVFTVAYSPAGQYLASGGKFGRICLWHAETGELITKQQVHTDEVNDVTFSADGKSIFSACEDGTIGIWQFDAKENSSRIIQVCEDSLYGIACSPNGRLLATGGEDHLARLWSTESWTEVDVLAKHDDWVTCLEFSPNGQLLATGSDDYTVILWNVADRLVLHRLSHKTPHGLSHKIPKRRARLTEVAFSRDGKTLATCTRENCRTHLWDATTGARISEHERHPEVLLGAAWGPGEQSLFTACKDGVVREVDLASGKIVDSLLGHSNRVWEVAVSPNGQRLATASAAGTIKIFGLADHHRLTLRRTIHENYRVVKTSPDGRWIAAAGRHSVLDIWDAKTGTLFLSFRGKDSGSSQPDIERLAFSSDGSKIAFGGLNYPHVAIWDIARKQVAMELDVVANDIAWSPRGEELALSVPGHIEFWNPTTGQHLGQIDCFGHNSNYVVYSPDGRWLATRDPSGDLSLWSTNDRTLRASISDPIPPIFFRFSPDGSYLLVSRPNGHIELRRVADLTTVGTLHGHFSAVNDIAFSRDGATLATVESTDAIRIWDMRVLQETMVIPLTNQKAGKCSIAFSPDDRSLIYAYSPRVFSSEDSGPGGMVVYNVGGDAQPAGGLVLELKKSNHE